MDACSCVAVYAHLWVWKLGDMEVLRIEGAWVRGGMEVCMLRRWYCGMEVSMRGGMYAYEWM